MQERDLAKGLCNMAGNQIRLITGNIICAIIAPEPQRVKTREYCRIAMQIITVASTTHKVFVIINSFTVQIACSVHILFYFLL